MASMPALHRGFVVMTCATLAIVASIAWRDMVPSTADATAATEQSNVGAPVHVRIPVIHVDTRILPMGLLENGAMDVPALATDVGWYALGAKPGDPGNAVLDGHLDTVLSTPGVFWSLNVLKPDDEIVVTDDRGVDRTFVVRDVQRYDADEAPMHRIFGPADGRHLNLITCTGRFIDEHYVDRLVVYAELADEQR
jgi:sortase (surface protein transpeptidase)